MLSSQVTHVMESSSLQPSPTEQVWGGKGWGERQEQQPPYEGICQYAPENHLLPSGLDGKRGSPTARELLWGESAFRLFRQPLSRTVRSVAFAATGPRLRHGPPYRTSAPWGGCAARSGARRAVLDRVKRKSSSIMQQLPFLKPEDYYLCERLAGLPADLGQGEADGYLDASERQVRSIPGAEF
ncbi:hypothetical protein SKAU_G00140080 [Synaphobranchus kaupii]|uniref:Uncharacterized protein n=1 Tax=Synaphobranchus kaupii TaxID=118154 RepID=A0A9Q1J223_SYNKA|nr:hypothetical protein SKAU_G00140080 [Synaphobranchus kaupii]